MALLPVTFSRAVHGNLQGAEMDIRTSSTSERPVLAIRVGDASIFEGELFPLEGGRNGGADRFRGTDDGRGVEVSLMYGRDCRWDGVDVFSIHLSAPGGEDLWLKG